MIRPTPRSVRLRLTLWHTFALALVLALLTAGAYLHFARNGRQRIDISLRTTVEAFVEVWRGEMEEEQIEAAAGAEEATTEFRFRDQRVLVYDAGGRLIAASPSDVRLPAAAAEGAGPGALATLVSGAKPGRFSWATIGEGDQQVRVGAVGTTMDGAEFTVAALRDTRAERQATRAFLEAVLVAIPLALVLSGLGGYLLARTSLRPVTLMADRADKIGAANLDERLPIADAQDELGRLGAVFNRLLDRLETALEQQRQFMADASHELRTPVAALRSAVDVTLARPDRTADEYAEALRVVSSEGRRLARIVDDLFLLARADAGERPVQNEKLYLEEVIADCARSARAIAAGSGVRLEAPAAAEAPFQGDEALLKRLVMNLLDNAIKHTPAGGVVRLTLTRDAHTYRVAVRDTGRGVGDESRAHIFERFYRGVDGRSSGAAAGKGAGLGLAIAAWIAQVHEGGVMLADTGPQGSTFIVTLPAPHRAGV